MSLVNYFNLYIKIIFMKNTKSLLGFTLIELLVVITIIGILATWAVSVFTSQIQKARDSTRLWDVTALKWGIEQYYQDTSNYPSGAADWKTGTEADVQDYLPNLAEDPKHDETCNASRCGYVYTVWPDTVWITDGSYEVSTAFENSWNVTSKAWSDTDNGEDNARLEVWTLKTGTTWADLVTLSPQATGFDGSDAADTDATVVIEKSNVTVK